MPRATKLNLSIAEAVVMRSRFMNGEKKIMSKKCDAVNKINLVEQCKISRKFKW